MNELSLLKIIDELLEGEKPKPEKIRCAKIILKKLIESSDPLVAIPDFDTSMLNTSSGKSVSENLLDLEAKKARSELT